MIDEIHAATRSLFGNGLLRLALGAHKQYRLPFPGQIRHEPCGFLE